MTIRSFTKLSGAVQIGLLLLLGVCFFKMWHSQHTIKELLENLYAAEVTVSEIDTDARRKHSLALEYMVAPDNKILKDFHTIVGVERGERPRPELAVVAAGERVNLAKMADHLPLSNEEKALFAKMVERTHWLTREAETIMHQRLAQVEAGQAKGGLPSHAAQPGQAGQAGKAGQTTPAGGATLLGAGQALMTVEVSQNARHLTGKLHARFLEQVDGERQVLFMTLVLAGLCFLLLASASLVGMTVFYRRVIAPLGFVGRYAEAVAAGENPPLPAMYYDDELAGMAHSLEKMKKSLIERIGEMKAAENAARHSSRQALLARTQALSSLELARRASRVQEEFLRRISHEVRTPMNAVIGMSYLCLQTELAPPQREYLTQISKSGSALLDMFNKILDFSNASEGSIRLEQAAFDTRHFLNLLRSSFEVTAKEKGLVFDFKIDPVLPVCIIGDEHHLEEVLRILLDNAVAFTEQGRVELAVAQIRREEIPCGGRVCLLFSVEDTGPGISDEIRQKLFQPFTPGDDSITRPHGGLGLGLALARRLVELMDSQLTVENLPGQGSRLSFELECLSVPAEGGMADTSLPTELFAGNASEAVLAPDVAVNGTVAIDASELLTAGLLTEAEEPGLANELDSADAALAVAEVPVTVDATETAGAVEALQAPSACHGVNAPDARRRTILVVDDNEINCQIAQELLEQAGLDVELAYDGQQAVDLVGSRHFDLIIMDVQMPIMDGMEATRRIRGMGKTPRVLPVLAMTAHTDTSSRMDGMGVGMNAYLTKPVDPGALYEALDKWLPGGLGQSPLSVGAEAEESSSTSTCADSAGGKPAQEFRRNDDERQAVNVDAGLAVVGGNKVLYNELLARFVKHYGHSTTQLRELLDSGDYRGAARLAHTVKGVAANLGVELVTELTKKMESSLPEVPPDDHLLRRFEVAMDEALVQIRAMQGGSRIAISGDLALADEHRLVLGGLLVELPRRFEYDWGGVESALERFMPLVEGTPYAEDLASVLSAVNDFDLAVMESRAEALRARLAEMQ